MKKIKDDYAEEAKEMKPMQIKSIKVVKEAPVISGSTNSGKAWHGSSFLKK